MRKKDIKNTSSPSVAAKIKILITGSDELKYKTKQG